MNIIQSTAMKRILIVSIIVIAGFAHDLFAQQLPQFTQYMLNNYITNPAVAGIYNYYQIRSNIRMQWVGLTDAPQTYSISAYGPHNKLDMGFGGLLFGDISGPTRRLGFSGTYAYNQQISPDIRVSGGISLGMLSFSVDATKFDLGDGLFADDTGALVIDPAMRTGSVFTPDASIGFMFYTTYWFAGISAHQLFGQKIKVVDQRIGVNRLKQHLMLSGGYMFPLVSDLEFEPSVLIKYMFGSPVTVDFNAKFTYQRQFFGGLSLRWADGAAIVLGMTYDNRYQFGYSFDYSFGSIRGHQFGSHEVMVAFLLNKLK